MLLFLIACLPEPEPAYDAECETVDVGCRTDSKDLVQACCVTRGTDTECWYDTAGGGHFPCDGIQCGDALTQVVEGLCSFS